MCDYDDTVLFSYHLHIPFVFIHLSTMATVLHYLIESRNLQAWVNEIPQSTLVLTFTKCCDCLDNLIEISD